MKVFALYIILLIIPGQFEGGDCAKDKNTVINMAETVWLKKYGKVIYNDTPFTANLQGDTMWIVSGQRPKSYVEINKDGDSILHLNFDFVPYAEIRKRDCKIMDVYQMK